MVTTTLGIILFLENNKFYNASIQVSSVMPAKIKALVLFKAIKALQAKDLLTEGI